MATKEKTNVPVVVHEPKEVASVESFITKAIETNVPIETLERLLAMRDKVKAEQAKEAFVRSMAQFQSECPIIEKKKMVKDKNGVERYKFAPIDSIVAQVKDPLAKNGLSYDFDELKDEKFITAICTITHVMGHSKQSTFKVEIGSESFMTDTQKYGARMTFAKRYAFCNALGIITGDEDNDSVKDAKKPEHPMKNVKAQILFLMAKLGAKTDKESVWAEIKRLTGMDSSDKEEDLVEVKSRLEALVSEIPE